jgi:hypothetical protein
MCWKIEQELQQHLVGKDVGFSLQSKSFGSEYYNDDSMSEKELRESEEEVGDNPSWVLPTKTIQVEELTDHGMKGENTLHRSQNCCHIVLFFGGPVFELQPCHYNEGFSQCICILW